MASPMVEESRMVIWHAASAPEVPEVDAYSHHYRCLLNVYNSEIVGKKQQNEYTSGDYENSCPKSVHSFFSFFKNQASNGAA